MGSGKSKEKEPAAEGSDDKEKGKDDVSPENVEQAADVKQFDNFLSGYKPDGKRRKCTDCLCILMLVACWVGVTYVGIQALETGVPQKLIGGVDYKGRICGYSRTVTQKFMWNIVAIDGSGVCLKKCPTESTWNTVGWFDPNDIDMLVCKDTTNSTAWWRDYPFFLILNGDCMFKFASTDYLGFCVLNDMSIFTDIFSTYFSFDDGYNLDAVFESTNYVTTICGDIWSSRYYILGFGFGGSIFMAYTYTYLMRIPIITKTVVWGSIWGIFFFALGLAGYAHYTVGVYEAEVPMVRTPEEINMMKTLSTIFFIASMAWLCIILYLKDRLTLAIGLIIQTAKALVSMPLLVIIVPVMQVVAYILFTIPWVIYCIMLAASGEIEVLQAGITDDDAAVQVNYKNFQYTKDQKRRAWFMLFGYFWTSEFIVAMGQIITAMCLCCYFFTRDKSRIGNSTVCWGTFLVVRYHMGTVAFGACVVAIVRLIRAYITYLEKYAGGGDTRLKKMILRCLQCFMACIERCIKYINFNAYIQTCIYGTSFCTSAYNAFWLIFRNIARIAAVTGVTHFLAFIGKLAVVLGTAGSFYYTMDHYYANMVSSLVLPTFLVALIAAAVAVMFFEVFGMGTTVLLQCFIADEELNKDTPEDCFADGDLRKYLNKNGKSRQKKKKAGGDEKK
jgi:choline transporter-like protein 2/4/5